MAKAILFVREQGIQFDILDINMGCPAPKITGSGAGSRLLLDPPLCGQMVAAARKALGDDTPLTVKMRIGWDTDHLTGVEVAKQLEANGADLIAVHGRTREQMYIPPIDTAAIAAINNDWRVCDRYKDSLFHEVDFWLDTHIAGQPKMIDRETFFKGIEKTSTKPFRVVPFFDPAPWGGQWMKEVCDLDRSKQNYGWCFDCVPEENSLYFEVNGVRFELPSVDLVLLKSKELLGEPVEARFGKDFPIRFDFLDTIGGGNLSLQVHPTTQFIRENFGMYYTQDESYYLLDAEEDAVVYLGVKNGVDREAMIEDLRRAQRGEIVFDAEKYVNKIPAKKHDHFLIPGGTIHCSGSNSMVLEISSTPNLFTFKLWDWQRLGLDGKPRPINVERGKHVINWNRNTDYVYEKLRNHVTLIGEGEG